MSDKINYPYVPTGKKYQYTDMNNKFMQLAMKEVQKHQDDWSSITGGVIVKNGKVLAVAAHGNDYHVKHGCDRKKMGIVNGQYELCKGCSYEDHSEPKAIRMAKKKGFDTQGADFYLWGHWWSCEPCWNSMLKAGIKDVYLLKNSEKWFNREHPDYRVKDFDFFEKMIIK